MNLPARDAKLRTTRRTNRLWHLNPREELHERVFEILAGVYVLAVRIGQRMDLLWTPQDPGTAQVNVTLLLEVWELEIAQHWHAIVVGVVVVPLVSLGMDEEDRVGEVVIIVDDVPINMPLS